MLRQYYNVFIFVSTNLKWFWIISSSKESEWKDQSHLLLDKNHPNNKEFHWLYRECKQKQTGGTGRKNFLVYCIRNVCRLCFYIYIYISGSGLVIAYNILGSLIVLDLVVYVFSV